MTPRTYTITLHVRSDAPIAVLRDKATWHTAPKNDDFLRYDHTILKVEAKELEPWEAEAQLEFGGCK